MEIYNDFAMVYDNFMEETPYERWFEFIEKTIQANGVNPKIVCDLGCGTGVMCEMFEDKGYEVIGIDGSYEMLMIARERMMEENRDILYLQQDMSEFELYGTVDIITSTCDCINYLPTKEKVLSMFKWVNNYLEKDGLFIFDLNTIYKYKNKLGEQVFAQQLEDAAYIWENYYDEETCTNEFNVTFFIKDEDGKYIRTEEVHHQQAYTVQEIQELLEEAGMKLIGIYDDYSDTLYNEKTERVTFVAKECAVEGKVYTTEN
ncbi:MAG: class I SAM-dependent DNA methyltransferase [Cellulosilyticaceae bacterium]